MGEFIQTSIFFLLLFFFSIWEIYSRWICESATILYCVYVQLPDRLGYIQPQNASVPWVRLPHCLSFSIYFLFSSNEYFPRCLKFKHPYTLHILLYICLFHYFEHVFKFQPKYRKSMTVNKFIHSGNNLVIFNTAIKTYSITFISNIIHKKYYTPKF